MCSDSAGSPFILMTSVLGTPFYETPRNANETSDAELTRFMDVMREWFSQFRRLGPPPSGPAVCGLMSTPFTSFRVYYEEYVGPFTSVAEFHSQRFCTLPPDADSESLALAERMHQKSYRVCLTHGDISPTNILVDKDYVLVGFVDWGCQCAAWIPEYWELMSAIYRQQRYTGWLRILKGTQPSYEEELAVKMEKWKTHIPY